MRLKVEPQRLGNVTSLLVFARVGCVVINVKFMVPAFRNSDRKLILVINIEARELSLAYLLMRI